MQPRLGARNGSSDRYIARKRFALFPLSGIVQKIRLSRILERRPPWLHPQRTANHHVFQENPQWLPLSLAAPAATVPYPSGPETPSGRP